MTNAINESFPARALLLVIKMQERELAVRFSRKKSYRSENAMITEPQKF